MRSLIVAFFSVVSISCIAQQSRPSLTQDQVGSIDRFVEKERARQHIPGVVGVYSRGKVLLTKGYGLLQR